MILAVLAAGTSTATAQDASPKTLVDALQEGGHVIFVRHASTERDYADQIDAVMGARVAPHLGTVPSAGANTVLVGHDDPFEAATGIYPAPMGGAYIIAPTADGEFEVLGHIVPDDWAQLIAGE